MHRDFTREGETASGYTSATKDRKWEYGWKYLPCCVYAGRRCMHFCADEDLRGGLRLRVHGPARANILILLAKQIKRRTPPVAFQRKPYLGEVSGPSSSASPTQRLFARTLLGVGGASRWALSAAAAASSVLLSGYAFMAPLVLSKLFSAKSSVSRPCDPSRLRLALRLLSLHEVPWAVPRPDQRAEAASRADVRTAPL